MCLPFLPVPHVIHFNETINIFFFPLEIFTAVVLFHASLGAKPVLSLPLAGVSRRVPAQLNFITDGLHLQNSQIMCLKHTRCWSSPRIKKNPNLLGIAFDPRASVSRLTGHISVANVKFSTKGKGRSVEGTGGVSLTSSRSDELVFSGFVDRNFWWKKKTGS